jgi:REP element-mobilizing transposase RayT
MPQSLSNILLHIVFSTKHREDLINPEIEPRLYEYMGGIHRNMRCPALLIGGTANHVHTLCRLERTMTVGKLLEAVKSDSSKWMKTQGIAEFAWQKGYGAFSIGASTIPALQEYIKNQKQHHATVTFKDEYRALLAKYDIEFDERYVWD